MRGSASLEGRSRVSASQRRVASLHQDLAERERLVEVPDGYDDADVARLLDAAAHRVEAIADRADREVLSLMRHCGQDQPSVAGGVVGLDLVEGSVGTLALPRATWNDDEAAIEAGRDRAAR